MHACMGGRDGIAFRTSWQQPLFASSLGPIENEFAWGAWFGSGARRAQRSREVRKKEEGRRRAEGGRRKEKAEETWSSLNDP